jgi:hypothetical protein
MLCLIIHLIQIYKIISHVLNFFSVYDFYKNILSKTNDQTYLKKPTTTTIKIERKYTGDGCNM